ncbi:MAG: 3-deoxy-7-phosphoheptulonate synthase [Eubacteriales bacterium]|nr:3-deoxy-7-phosphoheptulonate synthase [Clostridiales bacterium]MDD7774862.1 3-deoxy-7-phosphoheptulonate synthase [Eubacteriales bacterium]MDY3942227.1 3-deoxy-7-phosphoheptulonate synthase [Eubacteriales bacterium]
MNMHFHRKLPIPQDVKREYPLTERMEKVKAERDEAIRAVFDGRSDKFILVIGPCSADHRDPVLAYIEKLRRLYEQVSEKILIIPRIYTNKPRTTGQGYKGMLHQPDPEGKPDMYKGIVAIRDLHLAALRDYDFTCADEMLYPENYRYLSDLLSYVAVGARSVENQQHRLTASGVDAPVGMKNPTGGDLSVMMNSIVAAQSSHTFLYRGWEVTSEGNPYAHAILRGYIDYAGNNVSNYHYEDLLHVQNLYEKFHLKNPSVIVDTNHNNSGKKYLEQIRIAKDIVYSRSQNPDIKRLVKGLMIESYLEDGAQAIDEHVFGKSITDPCLGWEKTEKLILDIADKL